MFTGLVADLGRVATVQHVANGVRLEIDTELADELDVGDSIAVNGVCLTAIEVHDGGFAADAIAETLSRSSFGRLEHGMSVNLELPLRAGDRFGGHVVQGHVDGTGTVVEVREREGERVLAIELDEPLARYLVEKGSVALDGVSLTVSALRPGGFEVSLIPETLRSTTLGAVDVGTRLNVEVDVLAKHVERLLAPHTEPVATGAAK